MPTRTSKPGELYIPSLNKTFQQVELFDFYEHIELHAFPGKAPEPFTWEAKYGDFVIDRIAGLCDEARDGHVRLQVESVGGGVGFPSATPAPVTFVSNGPAFNVHALNMLWSAWQHAPLTMPVAVPRDSTLIVRAPGSCILLLHGIIKVPLGLKPGDDLFPGKGTYRNVERVEGRCGNCPACELERIGCGCDGALDEGCFLCTPNLHKRPPCPA